jgi:hypothetical protein
MASEPQPPTIHEGADPDSAPLPTNAEDRKTAAALSSLEKGRGDDDDDERKAGKEVDTEALGKAMQNLDVAKEGGTVDEEDEEKTTRRKKAVRVEAGDVALLVSLYTYGVPKVHWVPGGEGLRLFDEWVRGGIGADVWIVG